MKERLIYLNGKRKQVFKFGDININFLQYCNTDNAADYPDMQFDLGFMPMITKTIRDKHAVLRKLSNKKRKQLRKPWITSVILKSIKDGAYYCYCAYVLRISRYSDFLSPMLANKLVRSFKKHVRASG